jgi:PPM family protein phosphatase
VQQLIDQGRVREEAFGVHPDRNKIYNCLGSLNPPQVDLSKKTLLYAGDTLLLCSDGLWSPLSGKIITGALLKSGIMKAVPELLDEAEKRAGRECDNLSAIAITWEENFQATRQGQVSTRTMPFDTFTTHMEPFGAAAADKRELTDEEIEHAIEEIRGALKRHSSDKT